MLLFGNTPVPTAAREAGTMTCAIRKILEHCGLWKDPPSRGPPRLSSPAHPSPRAADPDSRRTMEVDPDFLEYARREKTEQPELPMDF